MTTRLNGGCASRASRCSVTGPGWPRSPRRPGPPSWSSRSPGPAARAIRDLTAEAERCGLTPKVVPSVTELLNGSARIEGVRDPRISDLLGRRPVRTDVAAVAGHFAGKRILVTGAGGSIGSELCRQLHRFGPAELIMLDRDESALHADPAGLARPRAAGLGRDGPGRHPRPGSGPRGVRAIPPADRLPRRRAQAPPAAGALPGRGGEEQRPGHPDGSGSRRRVRGRVVRQHLHRQGRGPGERPRVLQAGRGTAHRPHGRPGRRAAT